MVELEEDFLTLYGILQVSSIIDISLEKCIIKNIHPKLIDWIISYLLSKNILILDEDNQDVKDNYQCTFYYTTFKPIYKHFIMWLKHNDKEMSIIHPYIFKLNSHEFKHLLIGWIYGSSSFIVDLYSIPIVFLFSNQSNYTLKDVIELLSFFKVDYKIITKEENIELIYIELTSENTFLTI